MIKKIVKKSLQMISVFILVIAFLIMGVGYQGYQSVIKDSSIERTVLAVKQRSDYVKIDEISQDFLNGIVAIEDRRFYEHGALDIVSVARATVKNILAGEIVQGGSTITQQLAKNLFLTQDQTLMRKLKEMFIAYELESVYSKKEILELYVNIIYYGDGYTGINQASKGYFNKAPSELIYQEATLLAGLPQAPSRYALSQHYDRAVKRQQQVVAALTDFENK